MTSTIAYRIPLFDLAFDDREYEAVLQTLRERWISMGPRTEEFERRFAQLLGTPHAAAVSNCTAALHLALLALGVGRDDEVIVPSLTFVATVAAVRYVGAAPVFCDIQGPQNPTIDPEQIRAINWAQDQGHRGHALRGIPLRHGSDPGHRQNATVWPWWRMPRTLPGPDIVGAPWARSATSAASASFRTRTSRLRKAA